MKPLGKKLFPDWQNGDIAGKAYKGGRGGEEGFASYGEPKGGGHHTLFEPNLGQGSTAPEESAYLMI